MKNFAIIETGGKQYLVQGGECIKVGKLDLEVGKTTIFNDKLGNQKVTAKVINHGRSKKIRVVKFHNKTRSFRRAGHKQDFTAIKIESLTSI